MKWFWRSFLQSINNQWKKFLPKNTGWFIRFSTFTNSVLTCFWNADSQQNLKGFVFLYKALFYFGKAVIHKGNLILQSSHISTSIFFLLKVIMFLRITFFCSLALSSSLVNLYVQLFKYILFEHEDKKINIEWMTMSEISISFP